MSPTKTLVKPIMNGHAPIAKSIDLFIVVSSEDDRYLVKGGIGTYTGILTRVLPRLLPSAKVHWYTESPNDLSFVEEIDGAIRHYLSRTQTNRDGTSVHLDNAAFAYLVSAHVQNLIDSTKAKNAKSRIIVESPDFEGLLRPFFICGNDPRILRVLRLHGGTIIPAVLNQTDLTEPGIASQIKAEAEQALNSDIFSSITKYILGETLRHLPIAAKTIPHPILPSPVNSDSFHVGLASRKEAIQLLRVTYGVDIREDYFNIFMLGSVEKRKGVEIVLKAVSDICARMPSAHFYFLGNCANKTLKPLSCNSNVKLSREQVLETAGLQYSYKVHVVGYVDHKLLPQIYNAGDVFPICYLADNFPGTVLEIALAERPLIALARAGVREMVMDDKGNHQTLVLEGDNNSELAQSLARCIQIVSDKSQVARETATRFREHILKRYDSEMTVKSLLAVYNKLLDEKIEQGEKKARETAINGHVQINGVSETMKKGVIVTENEVACGLDGV